LPFDGRLSLVLLQTKFDKLPLIFCEPLRILGEIWNDEEPGKRHHAGQDAFQYEDPPPSRVPPHTIHLPDGGSEKASEGTGECGRGEKEGKPFLCLVPLIPHSDQIERSRKHSSFEDTEEESRRQETAIVLHKALTESDEAKAEHTQRQPDVGFESFQNDVGGDLEKDVRNEKDGQRCIILDTLEGQVIGKTEDGSIGDIGAVQEGSIAVGQPLTNTNDMTDAEMAYSQQIEDR
jgi:hypothetical protein